VFNILHLLTKSPLPLYFVDLEPSDNNKDIFDLHFLCNMKITVEAPRKKISIVQCTRCQSYGHTKTYCARPFVCVKCGGDHDTAEYTKDPASTPTCALCGGAHSANSKGCDVYRRLQTARCDSTPRPRRPDPLTPAPHVDTSTAHHFPHLLHSHPMPHPRNPHPPIPTSSPPDPRPLVSKPNFPLSSPRSNPCLTS
jgi:hypothetical protein